MGSRAKHTESTTDPITAGRATLLAEAEAIRLAADRLDEGFTKAVDLIASHSGKVVVTGLGKSGHVGRKLAATLCSTGTPAVFLHAAEAAHGDLGVYAPADPTILISKSGATTELIRLIPTLRRLESPLIGVVGNPNSRLAALMDAVLDAGVEREADPLNLVPTASSTVALALGDALAAALMVVRSFTVADLARIHPGGDLGRSLALDVPDALHGRPESRRVSRGGGRRPYSPRLLTP